MEGRPPPPRRSQPRRQPKPASYRTRLGALGAIAGAIVVLLVIVLHNTHGSSSHTAAQQTTSTHASSTTTAQSTTPGTLSIPILAYNVINSQPAGSSAPASIYVPVADFTAQMQALKAAGWHAVTLDQVEAYWAHGQSLGTSKPIVITFDGGYASQYANALPVLRNLGWVGVVDVPATLLPGSEGGISTDQVKALRAAGWELGDGGAAQPDLTTVSSDQAATALTNERQAVSSSYGVTPNWFAYPGGHYNATVTAAARAAGFTGALTGSAGWASPKADRFLLPRIVVFGGTGASQLLSQITSAQTTTTAVPTSA